VCATLSVVPTLLAQVRRQVSPHCWEDFAVYGVPGGLSIYGGVYYPGARSSVANTGGSRQVSGAAFCAAPRASLKPHELDAWTMLDEADRQTVIDWACAHAS